MSASGSKWAKSGPGPGQGQDLKGQNQVSKFRIRISKGRTRSERSGSGSRSELRSKRADSGFERSNYNRMVRIRIERSKL